MDIAPEEYNIPKNSLMVETEIKGSRFLAYLDPVATVEEFKERLAELKTLHPEARHHCWAYQIGSPGKTTLLSMSDDGEPSGTAGKPMLNVLQHSAIGDISVIVVRYFGGTKLGTGGLVRAYGGAVQAALDAVELKLKQPLEIISLDFGYEFEKDFRHFIQGFHFEQTEFQYLASVQFQGLLPTKELPSFQESLKNFSLGKIHLS